MQVRFQDVFQTTQTMTIKLITIKKHNADLQLVKDYENNVILLNWHRLIAT